MPSLGQMLVNAKVITAGQLEEAVQNQVIFGGRLGTNLIELGYLDEQTLTKYLSKKYGLPTVDWTSLSRIKTGVLKLFSQQLAKMTEAFPLKVDGRDLYVVMSDPENLEAIHQIGFATGKRVRPLVLPEVRLYDLLTRFYNIGRELRYMNLAMIYQLKPKEEPKKPAKAPPPPGVSDQEWREREQVRRKIDFSSSGELQSEDEFQRLAAEQFRRETPPAQETEEPATAPIAPAPAPLPPPVAPPPAPAAPTPPATIPAASVAPRTGPQPFKDVAQSLYSVLMKGGIEKFMPKATLQEFLKLFVKNQLRDFILPFNYLANWLVIEADAPVEWLEPILKEFQKAQGPALGIVVLLPGERPPAVKPAPAPVSAPPPTAAPAPARPSAEEAPAELEVLETVEVSPGAAEAYEMLEVMELSAEDMASVEEAEAYVPEEAPEEAVPSPEEEYPQLSLADAREKLNEAQDRKDIARIILGVARNFFRRSLLFTVRGNTLYGWDGVGSGIDSNMVETLMLPLDEPSSFQLANQVQSFTLGPMTPQPANERFLKMLGGERPSSVLIMPIVANQRVVYIIYGDNGHGQFVPAAPDVQILAYAVPAALERLIQDKKAAQSAS
jgi:hypothetical protein